MFHRPVSDEDEITGVCGLWQLPASKAVAAIMVRMLMVKVIIGLLYIDTRKRRIVARGVGIWWGKNTKARFPQTFTDNYLTAQKLAITPDNV
jgi:hypothetical protein